MKRIALLVMLSACPKASVAPPDAGPTPEPVAEAPTDAGFVLTTEKVDAYLRYQAAVSKAGAAPSGNMLERARQDEAARQSSGLSETELAAIDELVSSVIARRMVAQLGASHLATPDLAAVGQKLSDDQKRRMDEAMGSFKQYQARAKDLSDERRRFGAANVDLVLKREFELMRAWSQMMGMAAPP